MNIAYIGFGNGKPGKAISNLTPEELDFLNRIYTRATPYATNASLCTTTPQKIAAALPKEDKMVRDGIEELVREKRATAENIFAIVAGAYKIASAGDEETPATPFIHELLQAVIKTPPATSKEITSEWLHSQLEDLYTPASTMHSDFYKLDIYTVLKETIGAVGLVKFMRYVHVLVHDALEKANQMPA